MPLTFGQAAGLAGISTVGNIAGQLLANRANMKLAQYSYEQEREMIRQQNLYNSPAEQIKRYEEAGLNPALIYGNGVSSAGNQSSIARYEAPRMEAPSFGDFLSSAVSAAAQMQMLKKDLELKDVELSNKTVENGLLNQEFMKRQRTNVLESILLGVPDLYNGFSESQIESMRNSPTFRKYEAEAENSITAAQLTKANLDFQKLKVDEQEFLVNHIQPLTEEFMKLRNSGQSLENSLKEVRVSLNESLRGIGGERGAALIWLVLRSLLMALPH